MAKQIIILVWSVILHTKNGALEICDGALLLSPGPTRPGLSSSTDTRTERVRSM